MSLTYLVSDDFSGPAVFVNPMPARGVRRPRKAAKPKTPAKPKGLTRADLVALCEAKGLRPLAAHTKRELDVMLASGVAVRPAAYDKQNAKRREARLVASAHRAVCEAIASLAQPLEAAQ